MSDNAMTTDTIKDMVRARYGDIAARADSSCCAPATASCCGSAAVPDLNAAEQEVGAGFGGQSSHELSDAAAKCLLGALGALAQECLEGAVGQLDWIEVRRVRRQIAQSRAGSLDRFAHTFDLVNADIPSPRCRRV